MKVDIKLAVAVVDTLDKLFPLEEFSLEDMREEEAVRDLEDAFEVFYTYTQKLMYRDLERD